MADNGGNPEIKKVFLTIEYSNDGTIDMKGQVIDDEKLAIWLLDKAKDMIKAHTLQKILQAQSRIIKPHRIMNFIRGKDGR